MPAIRFSHTSRRAGGAPSRPWLVRCALGVLLVASAVGLAACGGGSGSPAAATTAAIPTTTTGAAAAGGGLGDGPGDGQGRAALTKYTTCLKQHGVTLPSFGGGGGAPPAGGAPSTTPRQGGGFGGLRNNPKFRTAQTACAKLLPAGFGGGFGGRGPGGGGFGGNSAAFAAYRNCLTLHGVKLAAGTFGRPGAGGKAPTAKEQAALKACASLRPAFNRQPPTGASTNPNSTTTS